MILIHHVQQMASVRAAVLRWQRNAERVALVRYSMQQAAPPPAKQKMKR